MTKSAPKCPGRVDREPGLIRLRRRDPALTATGGRSRTALDAARRRQAAVIDVEGFARGEVGRRRRRTARGDPSDEGVSAQLIAQIGEEGARRATPGVRGERRQAVRTSAVRFEEIGE